MKIAGSSRRVIVDICLLLILATVAWFIWIREPKTKDMQGVETVELSVRYLWDPESPEIQDWQVLGDPTDILLGPWNDLFISDGDQAQVLRCTTEGELIEVIGRKGAGPGEFRECWDLGYSSSDTTLWIVDRSTVRGHIARFKISPVSSLFHDQFIAPNTWLQTTPNLVVENTHSFWVHDRSRRAEKRILQINDSGEITSSFGDPYVPSDATTERDRWMISAYSEGVPELIAPDRIFYVYSARPVMELWTDSGRLLREREFDLPEIRSISQSINQIRREMQNQDVTPNYFQTATWHPESAAVYVMTADAIRNRQVIYAVDPTDFGILRRYIIQNEIEEEFLIGLAVDGSSTQLRFFCISVFSAGIVALEIMD
ncbi:hypothetical protein ACFL6R_00860 [Gemmatimonadota bacterium]